VTNHEFAVGTPGYMCPEQARGEEMDHRGDLYAIGVILFELLTGRLPFAGRETMDVLLAHATEEAPSFATAGASGVVSPALEHVIQVCLAKSPNDRPGHARELAEMYADALAASKRPVAPPRAARLRPPARRRGGSAPGTAVAPPTAAATAAPPEPTVVKAPTPAPIINDPLAVVYHVEAWMPEAIATYKLRGFLNEAGGELVESVPGRINVRLGGKDCRYALPARGLSWLGLGRRPAIEVELRLQRPDATRENHLRVTVVFRSAGLDLNTDATWRSVCTQVFCDLRAFLMAQNGASPSG
jgi:serine/threonine-protein kinase